MSSGRPATILTDSDCADEWIEVAISPKSETMSPQPLSTLSDNEIKNLFKKSISEKITANQLSQSNVKPAEKKEDLVDVPLVTNKITHAHVSQKNIFLVMQPTARPVTRILEDSPLAGCNPFKHCF